MVFTLDEAWGHICLHSTLGQTMLTRSQVLQSLKNNQQIPSVSWGYSAGAWYRSGHIPGSLTLGGFDSALFQSKDSLTIAFNDEGSTALMVGLQDVATNQTGGSILPGGPINIYVDSTVPYIYLPSRACEAFEKAFNLTWNPTWELYLVDNSTHDTLSSINAYVNFTLSPSRDTDNKTVDIQLPYSAFGSFHSAPTDKIE